MDQSKSLPEVVGTEKRMLAAIYSKGILHSDVLELYRRIRSEYDHLLSNAAEMGELQEIEYHLWKLHYQLIDEFRKRIRQRSFNADIVKKNGTSLDSVDTTDKGLEVFKSFLSEASEFYKNLIVKLRTDSGLPAEIFLNDKDRTKFPVVAMRLQACQHTCHRLLICLGDLARYAEIVKKSDACDWSIAAKYYLEATRTWPDSGNPHNQLALLATYNGDTFLALYHCVRSLAVKEPFPDAQKNIMLLFEENRSAKLPQVSAQMQIDFSNPSKRISTSFLQNGNVEDSDENILSEKFDIWPNLVRTISFFFIESSFEEFPSMLASAVSSLEAIPSSDDSKIGTILDCYQNMEPSRRGPYRAIHLVSMFIFVAHRLTHCPETEDHKPASESISLAFSAIFICMGRVIEKCLIGSGTVVDPLLPAVIVFVEWVAGAIDSVETYNEDEKVKNALSYFRAALNDLVGRTVQKWDRDGDSPDCSALWEDHELRGFYPLIRAHERLDFATSFDSIDDYKCRNECRLKRLFQAATWITNRASRNEEKGEMSGVIETQVQGSTDEEEVILFKPITRRNSAPIYISKPTTDLTSTTQTSPTDEFLRRATSLSTRQNVDDADSFSFYTTGGHNRLKEPNTNTHIHPAGPPSLSAWVLNQGTSVDNISTSFGKQKLTPIDEVASTSFSHLSVNDTRMVAPGQASTVIHETSPFITPTPSAPLLPDDAAWLRGNSITSPMGSDTNGILGAAPINPYNLNRSRPLVSIATPLPGMVDGYPPPLLGMSSSEWLYHYRNSQNIGGNHNFIPPTHFNPATAYGNYQPNELSGFNVCDQWGNHLVSNGTSYVGGPQNMYLSCGSSVVYGGADEQKRDRLFLGYQRPFPYVCGVGMEMSSEQPLVQYLKEKEKQMQGGSQLRNHHPTYMGN